MTVTADQQVATIPASRLREFITAWEKFDSYDVEDVEGILEDLQRLVDDNAAPCSGADHEDQRSDEVWELVDPDDGSKYVGVRAYPDDPDGQWSLVAVATGESVWASDDQFTRTHRLTPATGVALPEPDYQSRSGIHRLWEIGDLHLVTCGEAVQINREGTSILALDGIGDQRIAQLIAVLVAAHTWKEHQL